VHDRDIDGSVVCRVSDDGSVRGHGALAGAVAQQAARVAFLEGRLQVLERVLSGLLTRCCCAFNVRHDQQEVAVPYLSDLEARAGHDGLDQAGRCCDPREGGRGGGNGQVGR